MPMVLGRGGRDCGRQCLEFIRKRRWREGKWVCLIDVEVELE